jgi:hypothetical protein
MRARTFLGGSCSCQIIATGPRNASPRGEGIPICAGWTIWCRGQFINRIVVSVLAGHSEVGNTLARHSWRVGKTFSRNAVLLEE